MEALALKHNQIPTYSPEQSEEFHDVTTQFAELVDGSMRTSFPLYFDGAELKGSDGRLLLPVLETATADAVAIAAINPELGFEVRRRKHEEAEGADCVDLASGAGPNTLVVLSDFPAELYNSLSDVGGYNVTRKQTMLRIITKSPDGSITMVSQTLDHSDRKGLEAIYAQFGLEAQPGELLGQRIKVDLMPEAQEYLADALMGVYDRALSAQYGGEWYAGRRPADARNTYDFVLGQSDIVGETVRLKQSGMLSDKLMYDLAATMKKRFAGHKEGISYLGPFLQYEDPQLLWDEVKQAGGEARTRGDQMSACGVTLNSDGTLANSVEAMFEAAGYGNKTGSDKFGPLTFKCPKGHWNTRRRAKSPKDFLPHCKTCKTSLKC